MHALKHIHLAFNDAVPEQGLVTTDRHEVRLAADWISVDVKTFEGLIRKGTPDSLEEADRLVTGELLEGIVVNDAGFESWLLAERQRLRRLQEQESGIKCLMLIVISSRFGVPSALIWAS